MHARAARLSLSLLLLTACGGGESGDGGTDFVPAPPAGCEIIDPGPVTHPAGPYGTGVGETLADLSLQDCDGATVALSDIIAQAPLTLFNVGAGWCEPCIEETEKLDAEIFAPFCARGLRVVQVLFQDDMSRPATSLACKEWRGRFELNFPVLYDPLFETDQYFSSVQAETPLNFLVDGNAEIVFKESGTPAADLPTRIDQLLP